MAGTYLQQDAYGLIPNATPLFNAGMSDESLIQLIRAVPAVSQARSRCQWIVVTAMYQQKAATLRPPHTNSSECWLAFVDRNEHSVLGWTQIPLVLFDSYERNENAFKVMMPSVLQRPTVFVNHALPQARCLRLGHLVRARELTKDAPNQPHLLASRIPGWSGRAVLPGQLDMTRGYLERRNATADLADFDLQITRMGSLNMSVRLPVADTLWMIWPTTGRVVDKMSRLWMHEVARFSSYEKVSYAWAVSQVPEFKARLIDAIYIYSPDQRVCPGDPSMSNISREHGGGGGAGGSGARKAKRRGRRRGRRMRSTSVAISE